MSRGARRPLPRFLEVQPIDGPGARVVLGAERAHQIGRVLRMGPEAGLVLVDGAGAAWQAVIRSATPKEVVVEVVAAADSAPEWQRPAVLACAVIKGDRQEWLLEKVVELGLPVLQPLITARGQVRPGQEGAKRQRWARLVAEATEQCERAVLMELRDPVTLDRLVVPDGWCLLLADEAASPEGAGLEAWAERVKSAAGVVLCVGPEGGWTPEEREDLLRRGAFAVSLGGTILRAETAAIAAVVRLGLLLA